MDKRSRQDSRPDRDRTRSPLSLRANFSWTLGGNLVYGFCQWGMIIVLAKLGTTAMVGQFALGLAVTAPIIMFLNLQLRVVQATDARRQFEFGHYLALRVTTIGLAQVLFLMIVVLAGYDTRKAAVILVIGLAKGIESLSDLLYGQFQQKERLDLVARSLVAKGILSLVALGLVVYLTSDLLWGCVALAASWLLVLCLYDVPNCVRILGQTRHLGVREALRAIRPTASFQAMRAIVILTLPLGIARLLTSLQASVPRYFVDYHMGDDALGVFAAVYYLVIVGNRVAHALGHAISARIARHHAANDRRGFLRSLRTMFIIGTSLGISGVIIAAVGGDIVLTVIYSREYATYGSVFVWIMVAGGIGYLNILMEYMMTAARLLRVQVLILGAALAVLTIACGILIPTRALEGAALALAAGAATQALGGALVVRRIASDLR